MSTSFGLCEMDLGTTENAFFNNLWPQAAAKGISSLVASGDSGAADCDAATATSGTRAGRQRDRLDTLQHRSGGHPVQ